MSRPVEDNAFVMRELFYVMADQDLLGAGVARRTHACKVMPDKVIKFETGAGSFQNVMEWETWQAVKDTEFAKWFAPCRYISPSGSVLIMDRTTPATKFPDKMPAFLTDFKRTNYGMLKGKLVAHDYGTHLLLENGMTKRMRKADWWNCGDKT